MGALRTIRNYPDSDQAIVALPRNKFCYVTGMFPNSAIQAEFVSVMKTSESNSLMITANTDLVLLVVGPHESGNGCKHVLFARMDEHNDKQLGYLGGNSIPKEDLEKIIPILFDNKSYTRYQVLGKDGVPSAIVYKGEVGVPNFNGSTLWILKKDQYAKVLNPPPVPAIKTTEVKKDVVVIDDAAAKEAIVDYAAAKNALLDEATAKKAIAEVAIKLADKAEKKATTAETKADKATKEAFEARGAANAASKVANVAFTAYTEAVDKVTA